MTAITAAEDGRSAKREAFGVRLLRALLAPPAAWLLRALAASWRIQRSGEDPFAPGAARPTILAFLHQSALAAAGSLRERGIHVAVSRSRDGEHIARVLARLGYGESPRGSSTRGGAEALRGLLRCLRAGGVVAILVDGPRGPARVAKPGAVAAARLAGAPIVPVVLAARPCLRFASWDRMLLPLPFARVRVDYGEPLRVPREAPEFEAEAARARLEEQLVSLTGRLDAEISGGRDPGS
jgi:lysophospholipid acyltransferase (LPLAT)-like uncharacterized protein